MTPFIFGILEKSEEVLQGYRDWLKTPLAEKIDGVVDANNYDGYFAVVYDYINCKYRRVFSPIDIYSGEVFLYFHIEGENLNTEFGILSLVNLTMEKVKRMLKKVDKEIARIEKEKAR